VTRSTFRCLGSQPDRHGSNVLNPSPFKLTVTFRHHASPFCSVNDQTAKLLPRRDKNSITIMCGEGKINFGKTAGSTHRISSHGLGVFRSILFHLCCIAGIMPDGARMVSLGYQLVECFSRGNLDVKVRVNLTQKLLVRQSFDY